MNDSKFEKWVNISWLFNLENAPYFMTDIQQFGATEIYLNQLEKDCCTHYNWVKTEFFEKQKIYNPINDSNVLLLSQLIGFSKYWIFGLYEVLRKFRETLYKEYNVKKSPNEEMKFFEPYDSLNSIFKILENLRMPLAKYEAAKMKNTLIWPEIFFLPDSGDCGWKVYCKDKKVFETITRHQIRDAFLNSYDALKLRISPETFGPICLDNWKNKNLGGIHAS